MLDFSALLSKVLYTFAFVVFWFDYDLYVAFYVGFRNIVKKLTLKINQLKIKSHVLRDTLLFFFGFDATCQMCRLPLHHKTIDVWV